MEKLENTPIILYGAGYCGAMFAELLQKKQIRPVCFFDRNPAKTGRKIMDIEVCIPKPPEGNCLVIVTILRKGTLYASIRNELEEMGYKNILHIYELGAERELFFGQNLILSPDRERVWENRERFRNLEEHLEDELSKSVCRKVWEFLMGDVDASFPALDLREQYFAYDVYTQIPDEWVVDCGGFKGEVMDIFLQKNEGRFQGYTIIEPDVAYLSAIEEHAQKYDRKKIKIYHKAVSDIPETVRLRNYADEDSVIKSDGEQEVDACPLDGLLGDAPCTFLKIDVEGYEQKVLRGARELIQKRRPVVAIAAYHREEDFYELFEMLKEIYSGYHFFMRSYMNLQETILYAVPEGRLCRKEKGDEI